MITIDRTVEDTFYLRFTSLIPSTQLPGTLGGVPVVSAYEDGSTTEITAGITLGVDHDGVTGLNLLTIVATAANGFEDGKDYDLVITTGTVSGENVVGTVVGHVSLSLSAAAVAVNNLSIASGSAAISTTAGSTEATTPSPVGTPTNDYTDTFQEDAVYHSWVPAGGELEFAYNFNVGGNGVPVSVTWWGYCQSNNDDVAVYARNWAGTSWDQVGNINGTSGATPQNKTFDLTAAHVGIAADIGKVRFRFVSTGGSIITVFATDRVLCSYAVVAQSVGYANGEIWINTVSGTAGTEPFVNGTADNQVLTLADALTLSAAVGIKRFHLASGSAIQFVSDMSEYEFDGFNWDLDLNGQNADDIVVQGASVSGLMTSSGSPGFIGCRLVDASTFPQGGFKDCTLPGDITLTGAFNLFGFCLSAVAGEGSPSIDLQYGGVQNINFRNYSGGIEVKNMKANDNMSLEGNGQLVINANCTGGNISLRGHFVITDNTDGLLNITDEANFTTVDSHHGYVAAATLNTVTLDATASAIDGAYDPALIVIDKGAGAGQTRLVLEYDGATKIGAVDRNWKAIPDTTSHFRIIPNAGREHVNEGLAQAGGSSTITLNALASSADDAYIGQTVFVRSGTGDDQARYVSAYDGTTKIATVHRAWDVIPDGTSGYVMLPIDLAPIGDLPTVAQFEARTLSPAQILLQGFLLAGAIVGVTSGTPTQTVIQTDLTETEVDQYVDRTMLFLNGTLALQATNIASYDGSGELTVVATTQAVASGVTFVIV